MTTYLYQNSSPIDRITVQKTAGGGTRTYLYARKDISEQDVANVRQALDDAQMAYVASEKNGHCCLEVRGCRTIGNIEAVLKPTGALRGQGTVKFEANANEKYSFTDHVRNNMVTAYGVINVIADAGIIGYGHMMQKLHPSKSAWEEAAAGYAYSVGSIAFTVFGRGDKSDFHARDIAKSLKQQLDQRGLDLPDDSAANTFIRAADNRNLYKQAKDKLSKGGSDFGNLATGTAGAFIALGALRDKTHRSSSARYGEAFLGSVTALSGYGAALVKEKEPDPKHPPENAFQTMKQWVQERPNRLAGYGYAVSTLIHGSEAFEGYRKADANFGSQASYARKAYLMRGGFATANFGGELLLATASKGHGGGQKVGSNVEDTAIAMVADAVARQPKDKQAGLTYDLAHNFLASPDLLGGNGDIYETKIAKRIETLAHNPWLNNQRKGQDLSRNWADISKAARNADRPASFSAAVEQSKSTQGQQAGITH